MMLQTTLYALFLGIILSLAGCGKTDVFAPKTQNSSTSEALVSSSNSSCAGYQTIFPEVDVLFLIDNSSSASIITSALKSSLANTVSYLALGKFDYHIMIAPLIRPATDSRIVVSLNPIPGVVTTALSDANLTSFFGSFTTSGSAEYGFQRAYDLINANMTNGIFREGANTVIVVISNGDDTDYVTDGSNIISDNFSARLAALKSLSRDPSISVVSTPKMAPSLFAPHATMPLTLAWKQPVQEKKATGRSIAQAYTLNSNYLRFVSVVPFTTNCKSGYKAGSRYKKMSDLIYHYTTQSSLSGYYDSDSYDLCSDSYSTVFDNINASIQQTLIKYSYDYWPVSSTSNIDESRIVVKKYSNGSLVGQLTAGDTANGFSYVGYLADQNTRYAPSAGEPKTGYFIQLFGDGRVTYPECLTVTTQAPADYYGYMVTPVAPDLATISITKNGGTVSQSSSNGWSYLGYKADFNIRVTGASNDTPLDSSPYKPAIKKTGYMIKLNGNAIYTNSDLMNIYYKAAAVQ